MTNYGPMKLVTEEVRSAVEGYIIDTLPHLQDHAEAMFEEWLEGVRREAREVE